MFYVKKHLKKVYTMQWRRFEWNAEVIAPTIKRYIYTKYIYTNIQKLSVLKFNLSRTLLKFEPALAVPQ